MLIKAPSKVEHSANAADSLAAVYAYHQRSKHRLDGYAAGPATLDWDAQPNPFRTFTGAETLPLPLAALPEQISYGAALEGSATVRAFSLRSLAQLLRLACGLTAWKQYGIERWALRANPSSGNLHPTEVWICVRGWSGLIDGLYHYDAHQHALERRCTWPATTAARVPELHIALSTIYWREAWKYGERAFRYCHLDIGHAAAALGFAAAALGWRVATVESSDPAALDQMLGLTRPEHNLVEKESAECLFRIEPIDSKPAIDSLQRIQKTLLENCKRGQWQGTPNRLDPRPTYHWPAIELIAAATHLSLRQPDVAAAFHSDAINSHSDAIDSIAVDSTAVESIPSSFYTEAAEQIVIRRRSAQAYDAAQSLTRIQFLELLHAFVETRWQPLLNADVHVHIVIAVHRVDDVQPGLYIMPSSLAGEKILREQLQRWGEWQATAMQIEQYPLYQLKVANVQRALATLCCQQRIAGDGAVVLGFLAEFDAPLQQRGPAAYRELFWQAGALAHAVYLRATAQGIAATGIGCFFDDAWHELLGIENTTLQFLYHLAVGVPLRDERLVQLSGYFHLPARGH